MNKTMVFGFAHFHYEKEDIMLRFAVSVAADCPDPNAPSVEHAMMSTGSSLVDAPCQPTGPLEFVILTYEQYTAMFDEITRLTVVTFVLSILVMFVGTLYFIERQRRPKFLK